MRTTITCDQNTLETIRQMKRKGESYDTLLQKMVQQYNPDEVAEHGEEPANRE